MKRLGIIGTGNLSRYLCEGLMRANWTGKIMVSPHSPAKAQSFVKDFGALLAASAQQLVSKSDAVIVAVRPDQCEQALKDIKWPGRTLLVSVMAGVSLARLQRLAPGATIVRSMPVSSAALNQSPTPLFPANDQAEAFFELLGTTLVLETEQKFEAASVNGAAYGWYFALVQTMASANIAAGLDQDEAMQIVTRGMAAAAHVAANSGLEIDEILDALATTGGITAQGLDVLGKADALAPWHTAFSDVAGRIGDETKDD